jgi:hypothetical protein
MARYKLTPTDRAARIERRREARIEKASRRDVLRDWFDARREAADTRRREAAPATGSRGVDRVPARYRVHTPAPEFVVEHTSSRRMRRRMTVSKPGRPLPRLREQRAMRLDYAVGEALAAERRLPEEARNPNAETTARRWAR